MWVLHSVVERQIKTSLGFNRTVLLEMSCVHHQREVSFSLKGKKIVFIKLNVCMN